MTEATQSALEQIAEDPSTVTFDGREREVWLGPVTVEKIPGGGEDRTRSMVSVTDRPPKGAVGVGGEYWAITSQEDLGGGATVSVIVAE